MTPIAAKAFQLARIVSFEGSDDMSVSVDLVCGVIKSGAECLYTLFPPDPGPSSHAWQM